MIDQILKASKSDTELSRLLEKVREYAQVYLFAKQRQKGCDEMGAVVTLREDFRDAVERMVRYCQEKKYLTETIPYDLDSVADELIK